MLVVDNVSFGFANKPVLGQVSLECNSGEIVGVVGRSGCGKTTLINVCGSILEPSSGTVTIGGVSPSQAAKQGDIGYAFQKPQLLEWLSAEQNIALPIKVGKQRRYASIHELNKRVDEAMELVHIVDAKGLYPYELSGGMQTRVSIARAIVHRPKLLLLDEPFSSLDDLLKESLYDNLLQIVRELDLSVVLVTHDFFEAGLLGERIYVLSNDKIPNSPSTIASVIKPDLPSLRSSSLLSHPNILRTRNALKTALSKPS